MLPYYVLAYLSGLAQLVISTDRRFWRGARRSRTTAVRRRSDLLLFGVPVTGLDSNAEAGHRLAGWWSGSPSATLPGATAQWVSVALGGILFALIGIAMAWSPIYIVVAAVGFALCTWLAQSLARGLICVFASLGLLGAALSLFSRFVPELFATLSLDWLVLFLLWWATALLGAMAYRRSELESDYGIAEIFGVGASLIIAVFVASKLNFHADLLGYLTHAEDNAAWVTLITAISGAGSVAPEFAGTATGSVVPLTLGLLHSAQASEIPAPNAVFAAYTLIIVLSPMLATSLLRTLTKQRLMVTLAFSAIIFAWAYGPLAAFFSTFGHLSATIVFAGLLLVTSFYMFDRGPITVLPIGVGLCALIGGTWFPLAPLAAALAIALCLQSVLQSSRTVRLALLGVSALGLLLFSTQTAIVTGSSAPGLDFVERAKSLLTQSGGTATIDPSIVLIALGGTVALAAMAKRGDRVILGLSSLLMGFVVYVAALYALSASVQVGLDYGVKKVTYLVVSLGIVGLIAAIPRFQVNARPLVAVMIALTFGSFLYGGGSALLSRAWPGELANPRWLYALQAAVASQPAGDARPVGCYGPDTLEAYLCTRWAGAVTRAGDQILYPYRAAVVRGEDPSATVRELERTKTLGQVDLILLEPPDPSIPWSTDFFLQAGRVFGLDGEPIKRSKNRRSHDRNASR